MNSNYLIVMAGGVGSRFWPYSRKQKPKQFHDILGNGKTLIQETIDRFEGVIPKENIFIVANRSYRDLILKQLPSLDDSNLLLEPQGKNTAPCIAYGSLKALVRDPQARVVVCPSDHVINDVSGFIDTIKLALEESLAGDKLITLGISPSRPDTGYGYIQFDNSSSEPAKKVLRFTEKPDLENARRFIESGDFLWNSGIFIWRASKIFDEFQMHLPELYQQFRGIEQKMDSGQEDMAIDEVYGRCENISIDYGILERSSDVYVIPSDFRWNDLGTWRSLYEMVEKDDQGNYISGNVRTYGVSNSLVKVEDGKLLIAQGVEDLIIIQEGDVTMICKKQDEQMVKTFVEDLKKNKEDSEFT